MSEVSRFMTSPSLEGTLADSLISCVRMDISLLDLNGFTRCTPSDSTSPVTRPKRVSTPTFPDSTFATDENSNSATKNPTTAIPSRRNAGLGFTSITLPRPSEKIVIVIPPPLIVVWIPWRHKWLHKHARESRSRRGFQRNFHNSQLTTPERYK